MITKWGVKNFKSILDVNLALAPLTVLSGINSSGKSAFLHSIVMLSQAQAAKGKGKDSGIVKFKGDLIDLGGFDRICHNKASNDKIGINLTIPTGVNEDVHFELGLSGGPKFLKVAEGLLELKEKGKDKDFSIVWKGDKDLLFNDEELWRKIMSNKKIWIPFDRIEVNAGNIDYGPFSFLPHKLCYKPCNVNSEHWNKLTHKFAELLADIPAEKLTEEDAEKYAEKKFEEMFVDSHEIYFSSMEESDNSQKKNNGYDFVKQLFYLCANNRWWMRKDKLAKRPVLFKKIPHFDEVFSAFKDVDDSGNEYYKLGLSDWYHVLSNDDKHKQHLAVQPTLFSWSENKILILTH